MMASNTTILRGVKVSFLLLASLVFISIGSVISPQSAKAEGFLSQTVKCLVQTLLLTKCETATVTNPTTSAADPAQPAGVPAASGTQAPAANATNTSSTQRVFTQVAPISPEEMALQPIPKITNGLTENAQFPSSAGYLANLNFYGKDTPNSPDNSAVLGIMEPSQDGWRIAGAAWYWWVVFIAGAAGALIYIRQRRAKQLSLLSNPR